MAGDVIMSGPLFDGRAAAGVTAFCRAAETDIAEKAAAEIKAFLPTQYKYLGHSGGDLVSNPAPRDAGYYESQIHAEATAEGARVTDSDVVYGPWLEGVSNRNEALRFPGYGAFRQASQKAETESVPAAEAKLIPYVAAMNM